jgi:hypothetical protein
MGDAGRHRMETNFSVSKTIEPLHELLVSRLSPQPNEQRSTLPIRSQIAYLMDRWPDPELPFLETEVRALRRHDVPHLGFILHPPRDAELAPKTNDLALDCEYLPDAMVIEAEWQSTLRSSANWKRCGRTKNLVPHQSFSCNRRAQL